MKRILIVDDETLILSQMSEALYICCDFKGEINTVENGNDAIKEISRWFYHICFLDINLPDMDGLEVMKGIKAISPETSIVIMTGSFITDEMKKEIDDGASLFSDKPLDFCKIQSFMKEVLKEGVC